MFDVFDVAIYLFKAALFGVLVLALLALLGQAKYAWRRKDFSLIALMFVGPFLGWLTYELTKFAVFDGPLLWLLALRPPDSFLGIPGYIYGTLIFFCVIMLIILLCAGMGYMIAWMTGTTVQNVPTIPERIGSLILWIFYGWLFGAIVIGIILHH